MSIQQQFLNKLFAETQFSDFKEFLEFFENTGDHFFEFYENLGWERRTKIEGIDDFLMVITRFGSLLHSSYYLLAGADEEKNNAEVFISNWDHILSQAEYAIKTLALQSIQILEKGFEIEKDENYQKAINNIKLFLEILEKAKAIFEELDMVNFSDVTSFTKFLYQQGYFVSMEEEDYDESYEDDPGVFLRHVGGELGVDIIEEDDGEIEFVEIKTKDKNEILNYLQQFQRELVGEPIVEDWQINFSYKE